ncbi:MAG: asparagine--tRNA ligase [Chlamydiales bacterium]
MRVKIKQLKHGPQGTQPLIGKTVTVKGWVKTARKQKTFSFIEVNDGSTLSNLQVVLDEKLPGYHQIVENAATGASVAVEGEVVESPGKEQTIELHAKTVEIIGMCDPETYPLQKKRHTFEFLRTIAHLRPRTNTMGAVQRVRNALAFATHLFYQGRGFTWLSSPVITASDCEGAGELFRVTTLNLENPPRTEDGKIDDKEDFFEKPAYLTVSGQLNAEIYACAFSDVYTFGPTFRAENSNTSRHLAEFWMIEPEMAFADLKDDMENAESYLKYVLQYALEHCEEDLQFFDKWIAKGLLERLEGVLKAPFEQVTYSYAIRVLEKSGKKFEYPVRWGSDLQSEHERFLAEEYFKKPIIITDYPKDIKAFYMRLNDDENTVAAMDVIVPKIGEIVGGSQREDRLDILETRMRDLRLEKENYWWYLELRKYGGVPHAGYGVGFERLIQFVTGMDNIRDVIPFPRYPGKAEF